MNKTETKYDKYRLLVTLQALRLLIASQLRYGRFDALGAFISTYLSVICRWTIGMLSVISRPFVG